MTPRAHDGGRPGPGRALRAAAAVAPLLLGPLAEAAPPVRPPSDPPVALVGGHPIRAGELEARAAARTIEARTRAYQQQRAVLDALIDERLLAAEAARRGTDVATLLRREVDERARPATEHDARYRMETRPQAYEGLAPGPALARAMADVREERLAQRKAGFLAALRTAGGVRILLEPPRVAVHEGGAAARGPEGAPVTIVEFSDFQCPFCRRATPTLAALEKAYAGRIRRVFRHYPLDRHPAAPRAAEAAECAREQGRFWPMHERLFAHQEALEPQDLRAHAGALGLDAAAFAACLDSGRQAARWRADRAAAEAYDPGGTPLFFINGRLVVGAQPYAVFAGVIEEELAAAGGAR